MMKILLHILLFICLKAVVFGAEPEGTTVSFQYRCLGLGREFRQMEIFLDSGGEESRQPIRLNDLAKTSPLEYSGAPILRFFDKAVGGAPLAQLQYNPSQKEPLFIFSGKGDSKGIRVNSIEDSWEVYGANSYQLVNMSGKVLYWQVGEERFKVQDTDFKVIEVPKKQAKTPVIALEVGEDGEAARVYRAIWHNLPNMRRLIFVRAAGENETGSVRVNVVEDFLSPQP